MSSLSTRRGLRALLSAALYSCWLSAPTYADTSNWNTDASGSFTTAANWDNGVPDSDDTAEFNRGFIAYTVTFPGNSFGSPPRQHVIDKLVVRTNEVTLADSPLFLQPAIVTVDAPDFPPFPIVIGADDGDVAILNMALSRLSGVNATIGNDSGANGTLNVGGTFSLSSYLAVGDSGTGTLTVTGGGRVECLISNIGVSPNSVGRATIAGAGSTWTSKNIRVGWTGAGTLTIETGGTLSSDDGVIGFNSGSNGTVTVTGAGSTWTNGGILDVARGTMNITAGGAVSSDSASVGAFPNAQGRVIVDGAGSTWTNSGDLTIGDNDEFLDVLGVSGGGAVSAGGILSVEPSGMVFGNSTLSGFVINRGVVSPGLNPGVFTGATLGALDVDGNYLQSTGGRLRLRLGGTMPGIGYDQLQVSGAVTLNGILSISLANSFIPSAGNVFDILDGSSISGTFSTIQLPALAAGLSWNTSQLYTAGVLSVVSAAIPGDYNQNGAVDAADYTLRRDHLGEPITLTNENPAAATPGVVDAEDYEFWKSHFGESTGSGSGNTGSVRAAVPEPKTLVLLMLAATGWIRRRGQAA